MAHITDYFENSLEQTNPGKGLDARMGIEISKRPIIVIPRLEVQVRKTPTNGISNTVIVKVYTEQNTEYMKLNPVIVLMRKHNAKRKMNGSQVVLKHGKNKWVEPGKQFEMDNPKSKTNYLSNRRDFQFKIQNCSWFTPRLISDTSIAMSADYLMDSFIRNLSSDAPNFLLMTSNGSTQVLEGKSAVSLFGLAIRIDNPKFAGDIQAYPKCTMYQREPKYLYGEITKVLFRLEVKNGKPLKSLAVL
jgi:hypothetical protein